MKKIILLGVALLMMAPVIGQKSKVNQATKSLKEGEKLILLKQFDGAANALNEAKAAIDAASLDPSTADNYETWFYKAAIYGKMQEVSALAASNPYITSQEALEKALQIDKNKTERKSDEFKSILANNGFYYYNDAATYMQKDKYSEALKSFDKAYDILNYDNGQLFAGKGQIDTVKANIIKYAGFSAYNAQNYKTAEQRLLSAIQNPITNSDADIYRILATTYGKLGNKDKQLEIINDAKAKFPNNGNIITTEINYYLENDQMEKMISTLEKSSQENPTRDDYFYHLAYAYQSMAEKFEGKSEEAEYWEKASRSFKAALDLKPENPDYGYSAGVSFFNRGKLINDKMNALGTSKAESQKYDEMKVKRDELFNTAIPYFEKVQSIYASKGQLTDNDKKQYKMTLNALQQSYAVMNKLDKVKEVKAIADGIK